MARYDSLVNIALNNTISDQNGDASEKDSLIAPSRSSRVRKDLIFYYYSALTFVLSRLQTNLPLFQFPLFAMAIPLLYPAFNCNRSSDAANLQSNFNSNFILNYWDSYSFCVNLITESALTALYHFSIAVNYLKTL